MKPDSLRRLIRLRREVLEECSRHLGACLEAETAAQAAIRAQAAEITRQRQAAEADAAGDIDVETFAAWYPGAQARLHDLSARHNRAMEETARARAQLTAARTAAETADTHWQEIQRAQTADALRREQLLSDEAAARQHTFDVPC